MHSYQFFHSLSPRSPTTSKPDLICCLPWWTKVRAAIMLLRVASLRIYQRAMQIDFPQILFPLYIPAMPRHAAIAPARMLSRCSVSVVACATKCKRSTCNQPQVSCNQVQTIAALAYWQADAWEGRQIDEVVAGQVWQSHGVRVICYIMAYHLANKRQKPMQTSKCFRVVVQLQTSVCVSMQLRCATNWSSMWQVACFGSVDVLSSSLCVFSSIQFSRVPFAAVFNNSLRATKRSVC